MASKYIQKFPVPEGFSEILHDLAKEILRNQPADILDFSALYFKCMQEGTVLDYANRGQNIPCDFKTGIPKISERPQRKKPLNERDEALHSAAIENSANIAKKPMTPDPKLIQADANEQKRNSNQAADELVSELKGEAGEIKSEGIERINTQKSAGSQVKNKTEENADNKSLVGKRDNMSSAKASRKSERPESNNSGNKTKEMAAISEKFLDEVLTKQTNEVKILEEHINANKDNANNEHVETTKLDENQENVQEHAPTTIPEPQPPSEAKAEEPKQVDEAVNIDNADKPQAETVPEQKAEEPQQADEINEQQANPPAEA